MEGLRKLLVKDNQLLLNLKGKRKVLLDEVVVRQTAISGLDKRIKYWDTFVTEQSKEVVRMLDQKRRQVEWGCGWHQLQLTLQGRLSFSPADMRTLSA